jgi:hypothetical protein
MSGLQSGGLLTSLICITSFILTMNNSLTEKLNIFDSMDLIDCAADWYAEQQESMLESDQADWELYDYDDEARL